MKAVPMQVPTSASDVAAPDDWLPPGGYQACHAWALENRLATHGVLLDVHSDLVRTATLGLADLPVVVATGRHAVAPTRSVALDARRTDPAW